MHVLNSRVMRSSAYRINLDATISMQFKHPVARQSTTRLCITVQAESERRSGVRSNERRPPNATDSDTQTYRSHRHVERTRKVTRNLPPPSEVPIARLDNGETSAFFTSKGWAELGTDPAVVTGLEAIGITRPSHVQAAAFRAVGSGARNIVVADYAGSGKTLAYLIPLIQKMKAEETAAGKPTTTPCAPRIVVVVPTAELCNQVLRVCRGLSSSLRFRTGAVTGGRPLRTQRDLLQGGVDLIVGTPGRLAELLTGGDLNFSKCLGLVLDEADILLAESAQFKEQVVPLQSAMAKDNVAGQTLFVTATIPAEVYAELEQGNPGLVVAMGPRLHRLAPGEIKPLTLYY